MKLIGETVYVGYEAVRNVLVHTGESSTFNTMNATDESSFVGPYADYILYFPIDYTKDLAGKRITIRGIECEVIGRPDHERPNKVFSGWLGNWDMTVRAKRVMPAQREDIKVIATTVTRDVLGARTTQTEELYSGPAQARQISGGEDDGGAGTESTVEYYFVIDWLGSLDDYQTQQLTVIYKDKTYNVVSVENVDEKGEVASLRGVWNG